MSFLPADAADDESERALEAALSFLAECERSTSWLLGEERGDLPLNDAEAAVSLDFFSTADALSSPSASGDAEEAADVEDLALAVDVGHVAQLAATSAGKKAKQPRKHSNRARDERRQELVYLRKKVGEMEAQLAELKAKTGGAASKRRASAQRRRSPQTSTALAAVWGDMAKRQYQERQKAEKENVRLKLILERQLKMAKSLEKILRSRHHNQSAQSLGLNAKRMHRLSPTDGSIGNDERAVLDMLLSGVEQAHREVDAVFEANGLGRMEKPHRNAKVEHDDVNGIVMEIYANKIMPFDMDTTGRAVWRHFAHAKYDVPQRNYYEKQPMFIETDSNTIVESYGLEVTEGHIKANFHVKHILRRYFEKDRIIIVWCTLTDTVEFRSEPTSGIRFLEKGYIIIQRPQSSSLPADCSSLLKTCYIIRPDAYGDFPDQTQKIGALTDFALSSVSGTISTSHQMIENFLLSESLKK